MLDVFVGMSFVGMRVFVHGCAATPLTLLLAMAKHGIDARLKDVELVHIHTEGPAVCVQPEYDGEIVGPFTRLRLRRSE